MLGRPDTTPLEQQRRPGPSPHPRSAAAAAAAASSAALHEPPGRPGHPLLDRCGSSRLDIEPTWMVLSASCRPQPRVAPIGAPEPAITSTSSACSRPAPTSQRAGRQGWGGAAAVGTGSGDNQPAAATDVTQPASDASGLSGASSSQRTEGEGEQQLQRGSRGAAPCGSDRGSIASASEFLSDRERPRYQYGTAVRV